ncbi:hypothetical protein H0B56_18140 [Haloechinothrix sp. YIM 98757]|uniref:Uncharacterized protein n=1 Tax=Haloechinothrix aidingensis TaxID=2752311 RepID=A0A838AE27_9PSEU|nr:hypothetical protein [Haloechinothrix aidingensis]MBA0127470.1 hypothetical protein [Haloechinothrix aidingensis]
MLARQDRRNWRFAAVSGDVWQREQLSATEPVSSSTAMFTGASQDRHQR